MMLERIDRRFRGREHFDVETLEERPRPKRRRLQLGANGVEIVVRGILVEPDLPVEQTTIGKVNALLPESEPIDLSSGTVNTQNGWLGFELDLLEAETDERKRLEIARDTSRVTKIDSVERETSVGDMEFYQMQYGLIQETGLDECVGIGGGLGFASERGGWHHMVLVPRHIRCHWHQTVHDLVEPHIKSCRRRRRRHLVMHGRCIRWCGSDETSDAEA